METSPKKRPGRPPAGLGKEGEPARIRDYPKLLVTIRPSVRATLKAIAKHEGRPAWKVVEDSIAHYLEGLPAKERRVVNRAAKRTVGP